MRLLFTKSLPKFKKPTKSEKKFSLFFRLRSKGSFGKQPVGGHGFSNYRRLFALKQFFIWVYNFKTKLFYRFFKKYKHNKFSSASMFEHFVYLLERNVSIVLWRYLRLKHLLQSVFLIKSKLVYINGSEVTDPVYYLKPGDFLECFLTDFLRVAKFKLSCFFFSYYKFFRYITVDAQERLGYFFTNRRWIYRTKKKIFRRVRLDRYARPPLFIFKKEGGRRRGYYQPEELDLDVYDDDVDFDSEDFGDYRNIPFPDLQLKQGGNQLDLPEEARIDPVTKKAKKKGKSSAYNKDSKPVLDFLSFFFKDMQEFPSARSMYFTKLGHYNLRSIKYMSNLLIFKRVRNTRTQFLLSGRRLVFYHSRRSVKLYKNYIKSLRAGIKVSIRHLKEKNKNKILDMLYDYKSIITKLFELRTFYAFLQRKSKYESRKRRFRIFAIFKLLRGRKFFYLWNRKKERIFSKLKLFYI